MRAETPTTAPVIRLLYPGDLPNTNQRGGWRTRWRLRQRCVAIFGELPPGHRARRAAEVVFVRVLGPRQRAYDADGYLWRLKGLVDALVRGGWLVNDSPRWMQGRYLQDESRRQEGPKLEITIRYRSTRRRPAARARPGGVRR